jgi:hypothetical protein
VIVQRAREQLPLGRNRDFVGPLCGAQHGDDDANDRDGDNDADGDHDATARMIAAADRSSFAGVWWSRSQLAVPQGFYAGIRRNNCDWLEMQAFRGLTLRRPAISDGGVNRGLRHPRECRQ